MNENKCFSEQSNDLEAFLQSFEKPTQIYRFLMYRNKISPLFLQRNLSYMNVKRKKQNRKIVNINLENQLDKKEVFPVVKRKVTQMDKNMKINFFGVLDENVSVAFIDLDISLIHICSDKIRSGKNSTVVKFIERVQLKCDSDVDTDDIENSVHVVIPLTVKQDGVNISSIKLTILSFKATYRIHEDPPRKRMRPVINCVDDDSPLSDLPSKVKELYAELNVYKCDGGILLTDGLYEIQLHDGNLKQDITDNAFWQAVTDKKILRCPIKKPKIAFKLQWIEQTMEGGKSSNAPTHPSTHSISNSANWDVMTDGSTLVHHPQNKLEDYKKLKIFYQFLLNNRIRQQTEARNGCICPWCMLDCRQVTSLMCHLKFCHSRFNFVYTESLNGGRIDVSLDEGYDGSFEGNPNIFNANLSRLPNISKPTKRMNVTEILVCKSKKVASHNSESDYSTKQLIHGHTRVYYHTSTCQPIDPKYIEVDSEEENDPLWLCQKTKQMIDEFMDVNEGEKEVMKLWNLYVMHHNFTGDCQMVAACSEFVDLHAKYFIENNLSNNLILHFINLFDFGLLSCREFCGLIVRYMNFKKIIL